MTEFQSYKAGQLAPPNLKPLQDLLLTVKGELQEAMAEAEALGDHGVYHQVDEALCLVEGALDDLRSLGQE